jgi:hypothetical protein
MKLTSVTTISIGFVKLFHLLSGVRCPMSHTSNTCNLTKIKF